MRLLFDHNLSPRFVRQLADLFPGATHVTMVDLDRSSDEGVWRYARENDCIIVTKDSDFRDLTIVYGFPPRVIWLRIGHCTTGEIEHLLRRSHMTISAFDSEAATGLLTLIGR